MQGQRVKSGLGSPSLGESVKRVGGVETRLKARHMPRARRAPPMAEAPNRCSVVRKSEYGV